MKTHFQYIFPVSSMPLLLVPSHLTNIHLTFIVISLHCVVSEMLHLMDKLKA